MQKEVYIPSVYKTSIESRGNGRDLSGLLAEKWSYYGGRNLSNTTTESTNTPLDVIYRASLYRKTLQSLVDFETASADSLSFDYLSTMISDLEDFNPHILAAAVAGLNKMRISELSEFSKENFPKKFREYMDEIWPKLSQSLKSSKNKEKEKQAFDVFHYMKVIVIARTSQ